MSRPTLARRSAAEAVGTAALLCAVVGSGVMAERLAGGNAALALLANTLATGTALFALIATFGPVSGAHFNPLVTAVMRLRGESLPAPAAAYVAAQVVGAVAGVLLAHAMFAEPLWQPGTRARGGGAQWLSESIATSGLLLTIVLGARQRPQAVPALVAAYVTAAYWFTASTAFANPAVSIARALTRSFAGIQPADVPGFIVAQMAGALLALAASRYLLPPGSAPTGAGSR
jgi:glycerol uptake facilitator-like aquaporin